MRSRRLVFTGLASALVGIAMFGVAVAGSTTAFAGEQVPCDSTSTPIPTLTPTQQPVGIIHAAQAIPTCTSTVIIKTHTPTSTPTPLATETPAPSPTTAPTNTAIPATNTPTGGAGGAVTPPNTGSGDGTVAGANAMALIALGALLMLGGSASVVVGARKR